MLSDWAPGVARAYERPTASTSWQRLAAVPLCAVLGICLPLEFLSYFERYLFYLRPAELIPTYASAWLSLGLLCTPLCLVIVILSRYLMRPGSAGDRALRASVMALSAAAV